MGSNIQRVVGTSELVALCEGAFFLFEGWEEEEYVAVGDCEVVDYVAIVVFVAACDVAMEACKMSVSYHVSLLCVSKTHHSPPGTT